MADRELAKMVESAKFIGQPKDKEDPLLRAREQMDEGRGRIVRIFYQLLRLRRDYLLGLLEILCLRSTPAQGYLRLQAETAALVALKNDTKLALNWFSSMTEGRAFYDRYQRSVIGKLSLA